MKKPTGEVFHRRAWRMSAVSTRGMPTGGCGPQRNGRVASKYSFFKGLPLVWLVHNQGNPAAVTVLKPFRAVLPRPPCFNLCSGPQVSKSPAKLEFIYVGSLPTSSRQTVCSLPRHCGPSSLINHDRPQSALSAKPSPENEAWGIDWWVNFPQIGCASDADAEEEQGASTGTPSCSTGSNLGGSS